jgi:hypothetical protein
MTTQICKKKTIERGDWADAEIVNEDGTKILLSEMKGMDGNQYLEILETRRILRTRSQRESTQV